MREPAVLRNLIKSDQDLRQAIPLPQAGTLAAGVYETTETFRAVERHSCVCDSRTMDLLAVTGPAGDAESQRHADLFAAAPDLLAALEMILFANRDGVVLERDACVAQGRAAIAKAKGLRPPESAVERWLAAKAEGIPPVRAVPVVGTTENRGQ